jgi:hypothetical protein
MPGRDEPDRHGGVDVRAGDVAGRVDHHHDREPERARDPHLTEGTTALAVDHDRAAPGEHERERGEALGGAAPREGAARQAAR